MTDDERPTRATEPVDRLGRLAAAMTDALAAHPEYRGEKAIVMLDSDFDRRRLTHLHGYADDVDAVADMFVHLRAIVRASGRDLEFVAIPDNVAGAE